MAAPRPRRERAHACDAIRAGGPCRLDPGRGLDIDTDRVRARIGMRSRPRGPLPEQSRVSHAHDEIAEGSLGDTQASSATSIALARETAQPT